MFNLIKNDITIPIVIVPICDIFMCILFTTRARWFQLHMIVNVIITSIIIKDVIDIYTDPINNIEIKTHDLDNYFIIVLHLYHMITFKYLTYMDYIHHFLFVCFGILPSIFFIKTNILRVSTIAGCGIPGIIEYGSLVLVKHDYIDKLTQKKINSNMYAYFRNPLGLFSFIIIYISYINNKLYIDNKFMILFMMLLVYINSTFYNKLTIENYIITKYNKQI
tara:strand:- start:1886 stop:2548 length:663 start_codon:yes stop_codon:yes gene_type:complete